MPDLTPTEHLSALAHEINVGLSKSRQHRLSAAIKLAEARKIADENSVPWESWCAEHFADRSLRDVRRLLLIGQSPDPAAALEEVNAQRRAAVPKIGRPDTVSARKAGDRGPPMQRALVSVRELPEPERKALVETLSREVGIPAALPKPAAPPAELLARSIMDASDDTLRCVLARPEIWDRLRLLLSAGPTTDADPETGEIYQDAQRPSNRDVSAGGRPCPDDGPQANRPAKVAGVREPAPDQGAPADREGHSREGAGAVEPRPDKPGNPAPKRDSVPPAGLSDDDFSLPKFLDRRGDLIRTTEDPTAPDDRPAPVKRVRA